jgi:hypothetical protein
LYRDVFAGEVEMTLYFGCEREEELEAVDVRQFVQSATHKSPIQHVPELDGHIAPVALSLSISRLSF